MYVQKLQLIGGNIIVAIPRALARELGWTPHILVGVMRDLGDCLTIVNLERHLADTKRLRAHPVTPDPRTESPTAREARP